MRYRPTHQGGNHLKRASGKSIRVLLPLLALIMLPGGTWGQTVGSVPTLADFSGLVLPEVIARLEVAGITVGDGWSIGYVNKLIPTSATLDPDDSPVVAIFKAKGQTKYSLFIRLPAFGADDYLAALASTPLAQVSFSTPRLSFVPAGNAESGVAIPAEIQFVVGAESVDLVAGCHLTATATLHGALLDFMDTANATLAGLPIAGAFPIELVATGLPDTAISAAIANNLDLALPLASTALKIGYPISIPPNLPVQIRINAPNGTIRVSVTTSASLSVLGTTVTIAPLTITEVGGSVTASGSVGATSLAALSGVVPGVTFESMSFTTGLGANSPAAIVDGTIGVNGNRFDVTVNLQTHEIMLRDTATIGSLIGLSVPGLTTVGFESVTIGPNLMTGTVMIGATKLNIVMFRSVPPNATPAQAGAAAWNVLAGAELGLGDLVKAAATTLLGEISFSPVVFAYLPTGLLPGALPPEVQEAIAVYGAASRALDSALALGMGAGLNLRGIPKFSGSLSDLINAAGTVDPSSLSVTGMIDISVFAPAGQALSDAFYNNLNISVQIPKPPSSPGAFALTENLALHLWGEDKSIRASVTTGASIPILGTTVTIDPLTISEVGGAMTASGTVGAASLAAMSSVGPGVTFESMSFTTGLGSNAPAPVVDGTIGVNGNRFDVTVNLQTHEIMLKDTATIGSLTGLSVPGLTTIGFESVTIGPNLMTGTVMIGSTALDVVLFRSVPPNATPAQASAAAWNVLASADLDFRRLMPANIPVPSLLSELAALVTFSPALLSYLPADIAPNGILPPEATNMLTEAGWTAARIEAGIRAGLGMSGKASLAGEAAALLQALNINNLTALPLSGSFDSTIFSNPANLLNLDLVIPIQNPVSFPGNFIHTDSESLRIRIGNGNVSVALSVSADTTISGTKIDFQAEVSLGRDPSGKALLQLDGTALAAGQTSWENAFGWTWLDLHDLSIDAAFGANSDSFRIDAHVDLGKQDDLDVAIDFSSGVSGATGAISVSGEIPLTDIPVVSDLLNAIPAADRPNVTLTNVVLGTDAILATAHSGATVWDAMLFRSPRSDVVPRSGVLPGWNLAIRYEDTGIRDVIPGLSELPAFPIDAVKFDELAIMVSENGVNCAFGDLPVYAQTHLAGIYGSNRMAAVVIPSGIGLAASLSPSAAVASVKAVLSAIKYGDTPITFSGGISGVFGGAPGFTLAAGLPGFALPDSTSFLALPSPMPTDVEAALKFQYANNAVKFAFELDGLQTSFTSGKGASSEKIDVSADIGIGISAGFPDIYLSATTLEDWDNAFGLSGFTLSDGANLTIAAGGQSGISLLGKMNAYGNEVDVSGTLEFLDGVPACAIAIYASEVPLSGVMDLAASIVSIAGNRPVAHDFPPASLRNVSFAISTMIGLNATITSKSGQQVTVMGPGVHVGADLYLFNDTRTGSFNATMDAYGIEAAGDVQNLTIGPFSLSNASLDLYARADPAHPQLPHFNIAAKWRNGNNLTNIIMSASTGGLAFAIDQAFSGGFKYDLGAEVILPSWGPVPTSANVILSADLDLHALQTWLGGSGESVITAFSSDLAKFSATLKADRDSAQKLTSALAESIALARQLVLSQRAVLSTQLKAAQTQCTAAQVRVNKIASDIRDKQNKLTSDCNKLTVRICVLGICKDIPDVVGIAKCDAANTVLAIEIAALTAELKVANFALNLADSTLALLSKSLATLPVDMDPRVALLIVEGATAQLALTSAQTAYDGVSGVDAALTSAEQIFNATKGLFTLNTAGIRGDFRQVMQGSPAIATISFTVAGKNYSSQIPIKLTDPVYTARQMACLAMELGWRGLSIDPDPLPPGLVSFFHDRYMNLRSDADSDLRGVLVSQGSAISAYSDSTAFIQTATQNQTASDISTSDSQSAIATLSTYRTNLAAVTDAVSESATIARSSMNISYWDPSYWSNGMWPVWASIPTPLTAVDLAVGGLHDTVLIIATTGRDTYLYHFNGTDNSLETDAFYSANAPGAPTYSFSTMEHDSPPIDIAIDSYGRPTVLLRRSRTQTIAYQANLVDSFLARNLELQAVQVTWSGDTLVTRQSDSQVKAWPSASMLTRQDARSAIDTARFKARSIAGSPDGVYILDLTGHIYFCDHRLNVQYTFPIEDTRQIVDIAFGGGVLWALDSAVRKWAFNYFNQNTGSYTWEQATSVGAIPIRWTGGAWQEIPGVYGNPRKIAVDSQGKAWVITATTYSGKDYTSIFVFMPELQ